MKRPIFLTVATALVLAGCGKDSIQTTAPGSATDYSEAEFDRTVAVVFSPSGDATVTGTGSGQTVTVSGNGVTIVNSGSEAVRYRLSGTTTNGYLKIYSPSVQAIELQGVSLTNPTGAAINLQGPESKPSQGVTTWLVLGGSSSVADGATYTAPANADEDQKGTIFAEGPIVISGDGSLTVTSQGRCGLASDDYVCLNSGTVVIASSASTSVSGTDTIKISALKSKDNFEVNGGSLTITATGTGAKGISGDGTAHFNGGKVSVVVSGSNFGSSSHQGGNPWWQSSSDGVSAKGIKFDGDITFDGAVVSASSTNHEAIESKSNITVNSGEIYAYSTADDAINASQNITITGGNVCAHSTANDGLDANANIYIQGGLIYAIGASAPEEAIDVNINETPGVELVVSGGVIIAIGGLSRGATLDQACYQASSWSTNTWYALTVGGTVYAFKTPTSGGSPLVVSGANTLSSGVSVSGGTTLFGGNMNVGGTLSASGTAVTLSAYSGGNSGGGPGGGGHGPWGHKTKPTGR
ncbi:MAG: carbohydrate-binding domain-containing protein [Bacteroidales bacterium]|nr:carbohydrate-binding domain-containing protein [Bacteroidales bacterium]